MSTKCSQYHHALSHHICSKSWTDITYIARPKESTHMILFWDVLFWDVNLLMGISKVILSFKNYRKRKNLTLESQNKTINTHPYERLNDKKSLSTITLMMMPPKKENKNNKKWWKFQLKGHRKPLLRQTHRATTQAPPIFTPLLRTKATSRFIPWRVSTLFFRGFFGQIRARKFHMDDFPCILHYRFRHLQIWIVVVYKFLRKWCVRVWAESQTFQLFSIIWIRWFNTKSWFWMSTTNCQLQLRRIFNPL